MTTSPSTGSMPTTRLSTTSLINFGREPLRQQGESRPRLDDAEFSMDDLRRADPRAWEEAWIRIWPRVRNYLNAKLSANHHDIQDLAQMAMTRAARRVFKGMVNNLDHLTFLTLRIAKSLAIDFMRTSGRQHDLKEKLLDSERGNHDEHEQSERCELLARALHQLAEQERNYVYAHYVEGLKISEISEKFNRPLGSICSSINRALPKLKRYIKRDSRTSNPPCHLPRRAIEQRPGTTWINAGASSRRAPLQGIHHAHKQ